MVAAGHIEKPSTIPVDASSGLRNLAGTRLNDLISPGPGPGPALGLYILKLPRPGPGQGLNFLNHRSRGRAIFIFKMPGPRPYILKLAGPGPGPGPGRSLAPALRSPGERTRSAGSAIICSMPIYELHAYI